MGEAMRLAADAMGTRFELVIGACRSPEAQWRSVGEAALDEVLAWHRRLNRFDPGSALSRLNRSAGSGPVGVDDELAECLEAAMDLCVCTGGAFDPAMGGAMRAAGFFPSSGDRCGFGAGHVRVDRSAGAVEVAEQGVELDLGGFAKGWAVDRAAGVLRELGVTSALMHGGTSTVVAVGPTPSGMPWYVRLGEDGPVVGLVDRALSLSRHDGCEIGRPGKTRLGHVLDPRTGVSAERALEAAAVVGRLDNGGAAASDAWSTALLVSGDVGAAVRAGLSVHTKPTDGAWVSAHPGTSETADRGTACVTSN